MFYSHYVSWQFVNADNVCGICFRYTNSMRIPFFINIVREPFDLLVSKFYYRNLNLSFPLSDEVSIGVVSNNSCTVAYLCHLCKKKIKKITFI